MLLLTAVAFGGQDATGAFEYLPQEEGDLLRHRAQELLQIPRDKRLPLVVQEMKRLVTAKRGEMWTAEPERIAGVLRKERGAVIELILRALPAALAEAVREHLPPQQVKLPREVRPEVLNIVRWKLEECLARDSAGRGLFKFSDVLLLASRDLYTVCDRIGARALAAALAGLPEEEQRAFFEGLRPDQRQLASRAAQAAAARALTPEDSRALLAMHDGAGRAAPEILRSAGAQRLARALIAQSPEFAARVLERHRGDFGQQLGHWIREERARPPRGDGGRTDFVAEFDKLAALGVIDKPVRLPPPRRPSLPPPPARPGLPGGRLLPPPPPRVGQPRPPPAEPRRSEPGGERPRDSDRRSDPGRPRGAERRRSNPGALPEADRRRADPAVPPEVERRRSEPGAVSEGERRRSNPGALAEADRRAGPPRLPPGATERRADRRPAPAATGDLRRSELSVSRQRPQEMRGADAELSPHRRRPEVDSPRRESSVSRVASPEPERRRDPMADRAARQAGLSVSPSGQPRDLIAQRAALRAGVAPARASPVRKTSFNVPVVAGPEEALPARVIGKPGAAKKAGEASAVGDPRARGKGEPER